MGGRGAPVEAAGDDGLAVDHSELVMRFVVSTLIWFRQTCSETLGFLQHPWFWRMRPDLTAEGVRKPRSVGFLYSVPIRQCLSERWGEKSVTQGAPPRTSPLTRRWMTSRRRGARRSSLRRSAAPPPSISGINSVPAFPCSVSRTS